MATPQERLSQIRDLANQWEQLVGFSFAVSDAQVQQMADAHVTSLYDFGQWMYGHSGSGNLIDAGWGWAKFGISHLQYDQMFSQASSQWWTLTGQSLDPAMFGAWMTATGGQLTSTDVTRFVEGNQKMMDTFGWLKLGLNFQQFQQQKESMRTAYGQLLDDKSALLAIQFNQRNPGANMEATTQPTLSQLEKKQASVGVAQSVVR